MHKRLKELREKNGFTKKAVAAMIGMDDSQYGKVESGKLYLTIPQTMEIISIYGVDANYLLGTTAPATTADAGFERLEALEAKFDGLREVVLKHVARLDPTVSFEQLIAEAHIAGESLKKLKRTSIQSGIDT